MSKVTQGRVCSDWHRCTRTSQEGFWSSFCKYLAPASAPNQAVASLMRQFGSTICARLRGVGVAHA